MMILKDVLKAARERASLTQEQLSDRTGIDQVTISALELGKILRPKHDIVVRLARALNVSTEELFPVPDRDDAAAVNQ